MTLKIQKNYITIGRNRPGRRLTRVNGFVIHWIGAGQKSATVIRNNFENASRTGSTQFIVGYDGECIQTMDSNEVAYHVGASKYTALKNSLVGSKSNANNYFIGCECCTDPENTLVNKVIPDLWYDKNKYPNMGKPSPELEQTLIELGAEVCKEYSLDPLTQVYLHGDITGKTCHVYYINYPEKFNELKQKIKTFMETGTVDGLDNTPSNYSKESVKKAINKGIIKGGHDGNLLLTKSIYRQDVVHVLDRLELLGDAVPNIELPFIESSKSSKVSEYAENAMKKAYTMGIIIGDENKNLQPINGITRQDLMCIFDRLGLLGDDANKPEGYDEHKCDKHDNVANDYAKDAVYKAFNKKILVGTTGGDYLLHSPVIKQDYITMLDRLELLD